MADIQIYWEDLQPGQVRDLGTITPTKEEILAFAHQFDPQPFHLDEEAAKTSVFGGLCASGWHTCAMAMRLMVTNFLNDTSSLGSPGLEGIKWLKPVFPDDVLRLQTTVEGLSIAAISYYVISLLLYLGKAANAAGLPIHPEMAAGAFVPLVLWWVWRTNKRIHDKMRREG